MKIKYSILLVVLMLILILFVSLWNLISDGYDKQNKIILNLKKIIPRSVAVKVRDTIFVIPELNFIMYHKFAFRI